MFATILSLGCADTLRGCQLGQIRGPGWGAYGPLWGLMGPYGPIWALMGPILVQRLLILMKNENIISKNIKCVKSAKNNIEEKSNKNTLMRSSTDNFKLSRKKSFKSEGTSLYIFKSNNKFRSNLAYIV